MYADIETYRGPIFEPQRSYKWAVLLPLIGPIEVGPWAREVNGIPSEYFEASDDVEAGRHVGYPGLIHVDPVTVTFELTNFSPLWVYFEYWRRLIATEGGLRHYPPNYKRSILISLLRGDNIPNSIVRLLGCFPLRTYTSQLDAGSSEPALFHAEFWVDEPERFV